MTSHTESSPSLSSELADWDDLKSNLKSKPPVALITGASRGLGAALAEALAERGYQLILTARGAERLYSVAHELQSKTQVMVIVGDIGDPLHRTELQAAARELGGIDVLVNNAGILGPSPRPTLLDFDLNALREVFEINVIAQLAVIQSLASQLKSGARILNISSDAAIQSYAGWGGYGASKAAFEQLGAVLREEQPDWKIYTVDPGDLRTQMHQEAFPGEDISDRPLPNVAVPGLLRLIEEAPASGRYQAQSLGVEVRYAG